MFKVSELLSGVKTRVAYPGLLSIDNYIVLAKNRYGDYCSQNPYEKLFSRRFELSPHDQFGTETSLSARRIKLGHLKMMGVWVRPQILWKKLQILYQNRLRQ